MLFSRTNLMNRQSNYHKQHSDPQSAGIPDYYYYSNVENGAVIRPRAQSNDNRLRLHLNKKQSKESSTSNSPMSANTSTEISPHNTGKLMRKRSRSEVHSAEKTRKERCESKSNSRSSHESTPGSKEGRRFYARRRRASLMQPQITIEVTDFDAQLRRGGNMNKTTLVLQQSEDSLEQTLIPCQIIDSDTYNQQHHHQRSQSEKGPHLALHRKWSSTSSINEDHISGQEATLRKQGVDTHKPPQNGKRIQKPAVALSEKGRDRRASFRRNTCQWQSLEQSGDNSVLPIEFVEETNHHHHHRRGTIDRLRKGLMKLTFKRRKSDADM